MSSPIYVSNLISRFRRENKDNFVGAVVRRPSIAGPPSSAEGVLNHSPNRLQFVPNRFRRGAVMPIYCNNCAMNVRTEHDDTGKICCSLCGKVITEDVFTEEPTFVKSANGQARMSGNIVRSTQAESSESQRRALDDAYYGIDRMIYEMDLGGGDDIARQGLRFYEIAFHRRFTRGRRKEQVQAACLYIVCRTKNKPFLLIDFSEYLKINVYVLGAVFLQLCKLLSLLETPIFQKLVDPSLFIHRFADRLFGRGNPNISKTALQIVASMKRDWMQTGRKPSGLCGAALYISALVHGLKCSKSEIIKVVHICEATLTKRLIEFENTESGGLTIEEFEKKAEEYNKQEKYLGDLLKTGQKASATVELLCEHKGTETPQFAYGLCEKCYKYFVLLSGGLNGGSEPPAFQHAERKRTMAKEADDDNSQNLNSDGQRSMKNTIENDATQPAQTDSTGATLQSETIHDTINDRMDASDHPKEELENLSDIDDVEVDVYINTEEEKNLKATVWEEINREYLEEQAEKAAAEAAKNGAEDVEGARQRRKEKRQKRVAELGTPGTPVDAVKQMFDRKRLSRRVRYDVLEQVLSKPEYTDPKKKKIEQEVEAEPEPEPEREPEMEHNYEEDYNEEYNGDEEYNYEEEYNEMDEY